MISSFLSDFIHYYPRSLIDISFIFFDTCMFHCPDPHSLYATPRAVESSNRKLDSLNGYIYLWMDENDIYEYIF